MNKTKEILGIFSGEKQLNLYIIKQRKTGFSFVDTIMFFFRIFLLRYYNVFFYLEI